VLSQRALSSHIRTVRASLAALPFTELVVKLVSVTLTSLAVELAVFVAAAFALRDLSWLQRRGARRAIGGASRRTKKAVRIGIATVVIIGAIPGGCVAGGLR
jgi:hypothetical protein